ncbi:unnamed protein product [Chrysoparadoxa australica]
MMNKRRLDRSTSKDRERRERRRKARKERGTYFDVMPEGMDEATANQIAAQAYLQQQQPQGVTTQVVALPSVASTMQQTRHARRLYVGAVPANTTDKELQTFFEDVIARAISAEMAGGAIVSVYLNPERAFAFVELKSVELTSACMALDGILMKDSQLKIRRPSDYTAAAVPPDTGPPIALNLAALGIVSTTVPDGPNKIFVGGLPYNLSEDQVKELLGTFGQLKAFHLVRDAGSVTSKGYGFCEYMNPEVTAAATEGLNGLALGEKTLTVRIAMNQDQQAKVAAGMSGTVNNALGGGSMEEQAQLAQAMAALDPQAAQQALAAFQGGNTKGPKLPPTRVLRLTNLVTEDDLKDDEEYADILDDIRSECQRLGPVTSIEIPRPGPQAVGVGLVRCFVEYESSQSAQTAALSLAGRQFGGNVVEVEYHGEAEYASKDFRV